MNGQYGPEAVLNSRGLLLQNQYVYIFIGGTGTLANTFADEDSTDPGPNPAITSPTGNLTFFALSGNYDLSLTNPPTDVVSIALVSESDSDATGNVWEGPGAAGGLTPDVPNSPYGEGNTAIGYYALPNTETGFWNVAIGYQAFPSFSANPSHGPARSVAIGAFADVADLGSGMDWGTAVGSSATAAEWGTAIGAGAVSAENSVALGYQADASRGGITVGNGRSVLRGISVGYGSPEAISGTGHIVVGDATFIDANYDCLALGTSASVVGGTGVVQSVAIGVFAFVNNAANAIAMGWSATVEGDRAIAMGWNAVATGEDSVALGSGAVSAVDNQIVLGTTSHTTQIPGLPASVSGDKFLVADSSGNVHKSTLGPSGAGGSGIRSLPIPGGVAPDGTGTGNTAARPEKVVSTGTQTTNTPKVSYVHLLFDPSTDQHWMWHFILPGDYSSGGTIRLKWGQKGTSAGNVVWKAGQVSPTDSTTDMDVAVFTTANLSSVDAAPTTTEQVTTSTITLTTTGMSANREMVLFVGRDADNGSDTCAADATLVGVSLEYS